MRKIPSYPIFIRPFAIIFWQTARLAGYALLMSVLSYSQKGYAQTAEPVSILVLHSYHPGYKWTDDIAHGLSDTLFNGPIPIALHVEYMDTKRVTADDYYDNLSAFYRKKYHETPFKLIICTDNNAIEYMAVYGRRIFPDIPVVFCGFNYLRESDLQSMEGFVGVNEEADLSANLDLALKLHPDTTTLYIINDRTPTGLRVMSRLREIIPRYAARVHIVFLDDLAVQDLLSTLRAMKRGDLVFYTFFFRDQANRFLEYDESIRLIANNCPVPIYGAWDFSLGNGIVGGLLTSGYYQGEAAGKLALRILDGESVDKLPAAVNSPNRYMFDYRQLDAFDIKLDMLPQDAIVINKPPTIYQKYRHAMWAGLAGLVLQLSIIFVLVASILRRRRTEMAIRQSEKRLNTILETANEGFWEVGPDAIGVNVNAELCAILNRKRGEIIGHSIYEFANATNRSIFKTQLAERKLGRRSQYEITLNRPDGSPVHCQFNSSPLYNEQGVYVGSFAMVTDISQRKHHEIVLKNREAMLRAIFESTENGIVVVDENGLIAQMNDRFSLMFPRTVSLGNADPGGTLRSWLETYIAHHEMPKQFHEGLLSSQEAYTATIHCRDGRVVDAHCYPLQYEKKQFAGFVLSFRDITRKKRLESQLQQSQKMEALGTLTSGIAHDFNNILAAILGYTEILQYQLHDRPEAVHKISRILKAIRRAKALIQQIHTFSRPQQLTRQSYQAGLIIKEVIKLLQASLPSNITVHTNIRTKHDRVTINPGQIHQVVMNLCTNAVHAMHDEGGILTVIMDTQEIDIDQQFLGITLSKGTYLSIQIQDAGIGMAPELLGKIFDPYFSTKEKGRGTGLGLSVTLGIIKNHGGAIQVESQKGLGSIFTVYLPLSDVSILKDEKIQKKIPFGTGTILLVDDESDLVEAMAEMIGMLGYKTIAISQSEEALTIFKNNPKAFDMAIIDMDMPGLNGLDLSKAFRGERPELPIILCTGYDHRQWDLQHEEAQLFNEVLLKPIAFKHLAEVVHGVFHLATNKKSPEPS